MKDPVTLLLVGVLVLCLLTWVFWPGRGLLASLNRMQKNTLKVQIEDALKFLFDCEYKNIPCGLNSVAGNLAVSAGKATTILEHLVDMGLIHSKGELFKLTDAGRSYALRIIRVHRIWEKYLADETSVDQKKWHGEADLKEHQLTSEAAEKLSAQIGNPVYDPHGDPIPSVEGEMPDNKAISLTDMKEGEIGLIVHIEDEPGYIYDQLTALGFYPGMQVYILDVTNEKITFAAEGEEHILTPLFASAISIELLEVNEKPVNQKSELLSSLKVGEKAEILGISPKCRGQQRRRLLDLGIVPGTIVTAEIKSSSGDPVGYRVMGATIAIRKKQAELIFINKNFKENGTAA
ncbi:MAG TPA: metal-dependent transcriptional regulator [Chitinophagaceae bacterium]|nr:metal-dependent transcriptional regulator [Chitinophagaceae bacterium]